MSIGNLSLRIHRHSCVLAIKHVDVVKELMSILLLMKEKVVRTLYHLDAEEVLG